MIRLCQLSLAVLVFAAPTAGHAACGAGPALAPFTDWLSGAVRPDSTSVAADGRLVVRLDARRSNHVQLRRDTGSDSIQLVAGDSAPWSIGTSAFGGLLLGCVRFEGFGADDLVFIDGVDAGWVARRWRIPYHTLRPTPARTEAQQAAITDIDALTEHGARGVVIDGGRGAAPNHGPNALDIARRNTVAMVVNADAYANTRSGAKVRGDSRHVLEVGGGSLLRLDGRLVVITAGHIVPSRSPSRGVLAIAHDGALITLQQLLHGGRRFDLAVFGFADPAQEARALETYGGVDLAETALATGAFVFHIGFPDRWQTNEPGGPLQLGAIALPWTPRPTPVLTSGLVATVDGLMVRVSARLSQGDSGGGVFAIAADGAPRLIGPVSTVRSTEDGNPPDAEVLSEVTGGIFRLHLFDLARIIPNYFAEMPQNATK